MARLTLPEIPEVAAAILKKHQQSEPVKVGAIATDFGITVLVSDLPLHISGVLFKDKESKRWTIRVNRHEHKHRQRYTIAHEIAHFVLHRDAITDKVEDDTFYRSGLSEQREFEANALAAEILMPWHLIRSLMQKNGITIDNVKQLADLLEVSEAAIKIRLGIPT